jgi:hypothetical protein
MHLFNDTSLHIGHHICIEQERRGREQDRERVCVRDGAWYREEVASVVKWTIGENVIGEIRGGLKRVRLHKFQNNINVLGPTVSAIFA